MRNLVKVEDLEMTRLFYVDDALIFCEAEVMQIRHHRAILTISYGIQPPCLHVN